MDSNNKSEYVKLTTADIDPREIGWTRQSIKWHRRKSFIIALIIFIIWLSLFTYGIYFTTQHGLKSSMRTIMTIGSCLVIICFCYFKLIHKHVPIFISVTSRGNFIGDVAIQRQLEAILNRNQPNEDELSEIDQLRLENKQLREMLNQCHCSIEG